MDNPQPKDFFELYQRVEAQLQRLADMTEKVVASLDEAERARLAYGLQAGNTARRRLINFQQGRRDGDNKPWAPLEGQHG